MIFNNKVIIEWGYKAATSSTIHGGVTITLPKAYTSTNFCVISDMRTNNSGGAVDFQDCGWVSKTVSTIVIRTESTTYVSGFSWITIGY